MLQKPPFAIWTCTVTLTFLIFFCINFVYRESDLGLGQQTQQYFFKKSWFISKLQKLKGLADLKHIFIPHGLELLLFPQVVNPRNVFNSFER